MRTVSIVGAGTVGTAIGTLLASKGYDIKGVVATSMESAADSVSQIGAGTPGTDAVEAAKQAEWVFIATPDDKVGRVCKEMAREGAFRHGPLVAHFSGALGSGVLAPAKEQGARVLSVHPLQSLASVEQAVRNLPGSYISIEGDAEAAEEGAELIEALGGRKVVIPTEHKVLYHAGAAVASNFLVAVVDFAAAIYGKLGMERREAVEAVMPLITGTVNNIGRVGVPDALTGPIARGDVETVRSHIKALESDMPEGLGLYKELGRYTVDVGLRKGSLGKDAADELLKLLG